MRVPFFSQRETKMSWCRVRGCRFATSHVTSGHQCGRCGRYGHGRLECGFPAVQAALVRRTCDDRMPESRRCTFRDCHTPWTHATEAHWCAVCGRRGDGCVCSSSTRAPSSICPMCRASATYDAGAPVFTGAECVACAQPAPLVVFEPCRHAVACIACAERL